MVETSKWLGMGFEVREKEGGSFERGKDSKVVESSDQSD